MTKSLLILWLTLFLFSCSEGKLPEKIQITQDRLERVWRLTEIAFDDDFYNTSDVSTKRNIKGQITIGFIMSIFPEGTMTQLIDNDMQVYKWSFKDGSNLVFQNNGISDTLKVLSIENNKGFTFMTCQYRDIGKYKFHQAHDMLESFIDDPYYPDLNQWRIPATQYESKRQLEARVKNYLNHYRSLLNSSMQRPNTKIRLKNSKGVIKVFDGGIGLKSKETIPTQWLHTFFSDSQGYEVYDKLDKHFENRVIKKKTANGWRMDDLSLIDSLITIYK